MDTPAPTLWQQGYRCQVYGEGDNGVVHVTTPSDHVYFVRIVTGTVSMCSCPAYAHRGECKHARAIAELITKLEGL